MPRVDIRPLKKRLREQIKQWRREQDPEQKALYDQQIRKRVTSMTEYRNCGTLLSYVSLPMEVDTIGLLERAWADHKRVAVPRCVQDTREMGFYYITSMQDLRPQTFGVLEPILERCERVRDFSGSICIVPALSYDRSGYRLGYGAGYYDRFLAGYPHPKIGLCYGPNLCNKLCHGRYDVPVDFIATPERLYRPQKRPHDRPLKMR